MEFPARLKALSWLPPIWGLGNSRRLTRRLQIKDIATRSKYSYSQAREI